MKHEEEPERAATSIQKWLLVGCIVFVVYGSLVPLQYVDRPWADAFHAFAHIPYLALGVASRADWVANGVLYVPVGFLSVAYLMGRTSQRPRSVLLGLAAVLSCGLAVGVEFAQLFFPQRTVSLNDIFAEWVGSVLGMGLAIRYAKALPALIASFFYSDPRRLRARMLEVYAIAYLVLTFFPYDFLLSGAELAEKLESNHWGWVWAGDALRPVHGMIRLLAEVLLTLPLGALLVRLRGTRMVGSAYAATAGLVLGGAVELGQLLLYSGISQGASVLTRMIGVMAGVTVCRFAPRWDSCGVAFALRRYCAPLLVLYLAALFALNGGLRADWMGWSGAVVQLERLHFMPFYYHYFTSEVRALVSVTAVGFSYVPVGVLVWAHRRSPLWAMALALVLSAGLEAGKLFISGGHPDPTNVLLACIASGLVVRLLQQLLPTERALASSAPVRTEPVTVAVVPGPASPARPGVALVAWVVPAVFWASMFPAFPVLVCSVLIGCGVAVWYRPAWVVGTMAAALPVLDLAPWSGRFFLDEFDALLWVGLGIAYVRTPRAAHGHVRQNFLRAMVAGLVALAYAVSTTRGALPFQLPDANAFSHYYSPYNALRIGKGALWGFLAWGIFRRFEAAGVDVRRPLAWGLVLGLAATVVVVLWERVAFSGLWNFSGSYRVTGPFSAMHTGGAYIECFLAVATPFLVVLLLEKRPWLVRLAGLLLLLATTYALMVTFSRNGYAAFVVAVAIVLLLSLIHARRMVRGGVIFGVLAGAMLLVAIPVFKGEFAQARMATVRADLAVRQAHWADALRLRDGDWATSLFGMGLGRYPETNYWRSTETSRSGTYRLDVEEGNPYLRLGSGNSLYVEQKVTLEPGQHYLLKLDVRAQAAGAQITVPICEKWMLTSFNCLWQTMDVGNAVGRWRSMELPVDAKALSVSPWYSQRPTKLSLYNPTPSSTIDIDNVRLETQSGANLLRNGDFTHGLDHWFFATDGHLQWHIKSLYYGVLFDQGWFGLLAVLAMVFLAWVRAAENAVKGDLVAGASLAALSSFLVVGVFDTLLDTPRFVLLLLLLVAACFHSAPPARSPA